jgi:hypothetical protein
MRKINEELLPRVKAAVKKGRQEELSKVVKHKIVEKLLAPSDEDIENEALKIIADLHIEGIEYLTLSAAHGKKFQTHRPRGSVSKKTKHILMLATIHPEKSAKELYRIADKSILGEGKPMQFSTFEKKVSEARNSKN